MKRVKYYGLAISILFFSSFIPHHSSYTDYDVTVTGFFFGFDGKTGTTVSLAGARVELMDSDADGSQLFDDRLGFGYVQPNGSFTVSGRGGDPAGLGSKPDVYIRLVYNSDNGVRLTDELDQDRTANTPEHDHNNFEGVLDIGTWQTDVGADGGTWSSVWRAGCDAWNEYQGIMGENPPSGKLDIEYWSAIWWGTAWTNDNTMHWPVDYRSSAMRHEFGHLIRHSADGDRQHFDWDANRFRYGRFHDDPCDPNCNRIPGENHEKGLGFGFNEGWAEFWDNKTTGCGVTIDDECEGNARQALGVISTRIGGKRAMVEVLKANPYKIHSVDEFVVATATTHNLSLPLLQDLVNHLPNQPQAPREPSIYMDKELQLRKINALTKQAEIEIISLKEKITTAKKNARSVRRCGEEINCYNFVQAKILPITLKMECQLKEAALERIKRSVSPSYLEKIMENPDRGMTDSLYRKDKEESKLEARKIITNCFRELIKTVQPLKKQPGEAALIAADYEKKYASYLSQLKENGPLPATMVLPHFSWEGRCQQVKERPVKYQR